jgi:hypothetical protein
MALNKRALVIRAAPMATLLTLLVLGFSACAHVAALERVSAVTDAAELPVSASVESAEPDEYSHPESMSFWHAERILSVLLHPELQQTLIIHDLFRPPMG